MTRGIVLAGLVLLGLAEGVRAAEPPSSLGKIDHIVVLYLENRSFDNMFGLFPGANGLGQAVNAPPQVDRSGAPYAVLPPVSDSRFPRALPNRPWLIDDYVPANEVMPDLVHRFYQHQDQIDGGRNDRFAVVSDAGALTMGHHDFRGSALWTLATDYVLADNYFQGAFGGSFLNHSWLACACTPTYPDAPPQVRAVLDADGRMIKDGAVTPDGFVVNTMEPRLGPHDPDTTNPALLLPPQTQATLGDRLSAAGVSWAWYSGGWADAEAGRPGGEFQFHHQPYAFFARYAPGTPDRAQHLKDDSELPGDIANGHLPRVVFIKPYGAENMHPGYSNLAEADGYIVRLIDRLKASPLWDTTAVIITYDEFGGLWDHVAPPKGDRWGPGTRIPAIIVSPWAKRGVVDHTQYDTTSILKTIEVRFGLAPLGPRDGAAAPMLNAFR